MRRAREETNFESDDEPEPKRQRTVDEGVQAAASADEFGQFDVKSIIPYASMLVYGARRIGKTHLMSWIMSQIHKTFNEVYVFSGTTDVQPDAWDFIPKACKIDGFDEERLLEIMDIQSDRIMAVRKKYKGKSVQHIRKKIDEEVPHVMLIFDDIVHLPQVVRSGLLNATYTKGRHLRMSQVVLSQNANAANSVGRSVRNNVDYVFTSMMPSEKMYEVLAETYFGVEGKRYGMEKLKKITAEPFTFAVAEIHKQGRSQLTDYVTKIKADEDIKSFKAGDKKLWEVENQTAYAAKMLSSTKAPRAASGPDQDKSLNTRRGTVLSTMAESVDDDKMVYFNVVDRGDHVH